jgi:hypothetical protein
MKLQYLANMELHFPMKSYIGTDAILTLPLGISILSSSIEGIVPPVDFSFGNIRVCAFFCGNVLSPPCSGLVDCGTSVGSSSSSFLVSDTAFCHRSVSRACWRLPLSDRNLGNTAKWCCRWYNSGSS